MKILEKGKMIQTICTAYEILYISPFIYCDFYRDRVPITTFWFMLQHLMPYDNSLMIGDKPLTIKDICEIYNIKQTTCYDHINSLKKIGLVKECEFNKMKMMYINPYLVRKSIGISKNTRNLFKGDIYEDREQETKI